jgi:hypothetical protein
MDMNDSISEYIPMSYEYSKRPRFELFYSKREFESNIELLGNCLEKAISTVESHYKFNRGYRLALCIYDSITAAMETFKRNIASTALLLPSSDEKESLIICLSPAVDMNNSIEDRMIRQLIHELAHIILTLEFHGTRKLGDHNRGMPIAIWEDEALAEYLRLTIQDKKEKIIEAGNYYQEHEGKCDLSKGFDSYLTKSSEEINEYRYALGKMHTEYRIHNENTGNIIELINWFKLENIRRP